MPDTLAWQWTDWDQALIDRIHLPPSFLERLSPGDRTLSLNLIPDDRSGLPSLVPLLYTGLWRECGWRETEIELPADAFNDQFPPASTLAAFERPVIAVAAERVRFTVTNTQQLLRVALDVWNLDLDYVMRPGSVSFTEQDGGIFVFHAAQNGLEFLFAAAERVATENGWDFAWIADT